MPQMAPYNWILMFLIFNLIFMMIISYNYFINLQTFKYLKFIKKNNKIYNWKW